VEAIIGALRWVGKGRQVEITEEERQEIVAGCRKWRPICEEINTEFKNLWEYGSSAQKRKEARGRLSERFRISVADVQAIESFLSNPSPKANKRTPHDAMLHRVAREHYGPGVKTIEKIWGEHLDAHPEDSRRKPRKTR
jgi:hypothetical protein